MSDLMIVSGRSNQTLAENIARSLGRELSPVTIRNFSDGEIWVKYEENIRGNDLFIIQSTNAPAEHLMELLIMIDAAKRASAKRITAVIPYFAYARQERKSAPRTPITAKLVADLIEASGFNRMLTMELHNAAIQGFFNIPVDHLFAKPIFSNYFSAELTNPIVVSPDAGGVERARAMAKHFNCGLAIVDKRRDRPNESDVMHIIGDIKGKNVILIDDIIDTAGSITKAADAMLKEGALSVSAAISHPVLSGPALERIQKSSIKELVVTDSIALSPEARNVTKIRQLTVAELFGKAIRRINSNDSVSALFL